MAKRGAPPPVPVGPMELSPVTFAWCGRCTTSDVMSTVNTTKESVALPASSVMMQRQRLSLPFSEGKSALSKPDWWSDKMLKAERERFMRKLAAERADREALERWAATRVQAAFRGFRERPRRRRRRRVQQTSSKESIRAYLLSLTDEMSRQLQQEAAEAEEAQRAAGDAAGGGGGEDWSTAADGGGGGGGGKDAIKAGKALSRKKKKRQRRMESAAAAVLQSLIRGYLARVGMRRLRRKAEEERLREAASRIQAPLRGALARKQVRASVGAKRSVAATRIQAMARGVLSRKRARTLRERMYVTARESLAAARIQSIGRQRAAEKKVVEVRTHQAASRLQSRFRGAAARGVFQALVERRDAATLVQTLVRRRAAENLLRFKRRDKASRRIQRAYRGHLGRTTAERQRRRIEEMAASVRMQAIARGWLGRRKASQMRVDAETARRAEVRLMMVEDAASDKYEALLQGTLREAAAVAIQCLVRRRRAHFAVLRARKDQQVRLKRLANSLFQQAGARDRRLRRVKRPVAPYLAYMHLLFPTAATRKKWDVAATEIQCTLRQFLARMRVNRLRREQQEALWVRPGARAGRRPPRSRLADLIAPPKGQPPPMDGSPAPVDW